MKSWAILLLLAFPYPYPVMAQGWIEPVIPSRPDFGIVKLRTEVTVLVSGRIAQVEVNEWFQNRGSGLGEGDYLYPLPGEAVFSDFSLFQGDEELRGETMDAATARRIYEAIVRKRKDPALIELVGHGLIRARVFPIGPGETRRVTLRYTQLLERAGQALQFRYAAGAVPRQPTGSDSRGPIAPLGVPVTFQLVADSGQLFGQPFSPTHELLVERRDGRMMVRPRSEFSGDFTLFLPLANRPVGLALATHRAEGEPGYFMLTLSPGKTPARAVPRDLVAVLDVSGSMSGPKIEQARRALLQLLGTLRASDRFRLITFSNEAVSYRSSWTNALASEIEQARRWIESIEAGGGTNIEAALNEAFRHPAHPHRLSLVVFITDGLPSVGERDPERLAARAESSRGGARIFTFGVGYDVNVYLLERLAASGRGSPQYVRPGEDVEAAVGQLAAKIAHPVLTDLRIEEAPVRLSEVYPRNLPDLFAGEELVIFGRYDPSAADRRRRLVVSGRRGDERVEFFVEAEFPEVRPGNRFIPRLWAARKIGWLGQALRLEGPNAELEREIRETALRYGLLSEYTAYLVQEPLETAVRPPMLRDRVASPMLMAPEAATGRAAVEIADRSLGLRELRSIAEMKAQEEGASRAVGSIDTKLVSGRLFALREGIWVDLYHQSRSKVRAIAPYSEAYFDLLRALPELVPYWREFDRVLVAGSRISIVVSPGGSERLTPAELRELAREFRGT